MSEQLDPQTFDLVGVLSGRDFPEIEVPVYFNEKLGFDIYTVEKELKAAEVRSERDKVEELDKRREGLLKQAETERYVVTLKGVPEDVYRAIIEKVQDEYPDETDLLGRSKPNPKGDQEFTKQLWQSYIVSVKAPDGRTAVAGPAEIDALISKAPGPAQASITNGISELRSGVESGFESAAQEADFLSHASLAD